MHGIKEVVNQYLDKLLDETVKVGMGIEYGNVLWTRIGLSDANQVKPISEVSFIAGKFKPCKFMGSDNGQEYCRMGSR